MTIIEKLNARIVEECAIIDVESRFDELLDEIYSFECVGGPFAWMTPSRVLREVDPIAHRCGVSDLPDSEEWTEVDGEYYEDDAIDEVKEALVAELESEIVDLENEIGERGEDNQSAELNEKLTRLNVDLAALNEHSF